MRGHGTIGTSARVLGIIVSAIWLLVLIGGLFGDDPGATDDAAAEGLVLGALVMVAMVATALSFRFGAAAAWGVIAAGLALSVFGAVTAGRNQWMAVLVAGVPWLLVGTLFLLSARHPDPRRGRDASH